MIFLTEEDVRQRCELGQGGEFCHFRPANA